MITAKLEKASVSVIFAISGISIVPSKMITIIRVNGKMFSKYCRNLKTLKI